MEVVTLLLFVGALWVLGALALFAWNLLDAGHEHGDRLAILPLQDNWTDTHTAAPAPVNDVKEGKARTP